MKKYFLFFLLITSLFGLGELNDIPHDGRIVLIKKILKNLGVDKPSNKLIRHFNDFMVDGFRSGWYAKWYDATDFADPKINKEKSLFVDVVLVNKNRINNFVFIRVPKKDRIIGICFQSIEGMASDILDYYKVISKDKKYLALKDTENYSYFHKKNYLSDIIFHLKGKVGSVNYLDLISIPIK